MVVSDPSGCTCQISFRIHHVDLIECDQLVVYINARIDKFVGRSQDGYIRLPVDQDAAPYVGLIPVTRDLYLGIHVSTGVGNDAPHKKLEDQYRKLGSSYIKIKNRNLVICLIEKVILPTYFQRFHSFIRHLQ